MGPCEFSRTWLFLVWGPGKEKVLNSFYREHLGIVEVPNHPMMLEIFK